MGNSHPRNNKLKIYIETQKPFFNSGSTIEGVVFVQCQQNFTFDALSIRIQGDQWCQWFQGSSLNRRKFTGNQNFYSVQHLLEKFTDKTLQAGSYAYPFSIQLSQNIPGSFSCSKYDAKIQYKLGAYFVNYSAPEQTQIQYIPLLIRQPFRQQIVPYQGTVQRTPKTCFCINHGVIILHAWFQRNVAYEGQQVKIQIIGDNRKGNSDINQFLIELVQYTFVSSNNGTCQTYSKIVKSQTHVEHIKISQKKTFQLDFKIPQVEHQTAISTLVANYYRLQVSTKSSKIASSEPCIYAPIFILKRTFEGVDKDPKNIKMMNANMSKYKIKKTLFFRAPQYWFKKNKNLSVMNFKLQDHFGISNENNF